MVKIKGALFSESASGSVTPCMTFSNRKSGQQVRFQRKQKTKTPSWAQSNEHNIYRTIYIYWLCITTAQKKIYNDLATQKNLHCSGWNYFLKLAIHDPLTYIGLIGYWAFDHIGVGSFMDISKQNHVMTLYPAWPSNGPQYIDSKNKKLQNALLFDGNDDYAQALTALNLTSVSISAWIRLDKYPVAHATTPVGFSVGGQGADSYDKQLQIDHSGKISFYIYSGTQKRVVSTTTLVLGQWYYVVGTTDDTNINIYINGILENSLPAGASYPGNNYLVLSFVKTGELEFFKGGIDDVRIYNRALTNTEILNIYKVYK
jgi:hypothetical protein